MHIINNANPLILYIVVVTTFFFSFVTSQSYNE